MKILRRLRSWIAWQKVPVDDLLIKRPAKEAAIATTFAVLYVLAAVGLRVREEVRASRPLQGAT